MWQQPFLLTVTYARGLQYWAEKLNLPDGSNFHPMMGSVIELKEMIKEHIVFSNGDLLWDLGGLTRGLQTKGPKPAHPVE